MNKKLNKSLGAGQKIGSGGGGQTNIFSPSFINAD